MTLRIEPICWGAYDVLNDDNEVVAEVATLAEAEAVALGCGVAA